MAGDTGPVHVPRWTEHRGYLFGVGHVALDAYRGVVTDRSGQVLWVSDRQDGPGARVRAGLEARAQIDTIVESLRGGGGR